MTELNKIVAEKLATRSLTDDQISTIANAISKAPYPVTDLNICTVGIKIDLDVPTRLDALDLESIINLATGPVHGIEIFPNGIPIQDLTRVRLTHGI